ncbi:MAG: hypothetical protein HFJ12_06865 [Bacilli bacterium]|nr:hypothetical protein [Bacilli bacterium]
MEELTIKVNNFINEQLLDFNNIKTNKLEGANLKEKILNRLFSRKWSRKAQFEDAKKYTKEKVDTILNNNLNFLFCFCFGGYKHFWSPTYPEPDWAEIFTIKYLIEYVLPIAETQDQKVNIEFESEEVALTYMNNTPQDGMDRYNDVFKTLINYINNRITYPVDLSVALARDFYDKDELLKKMYDYLPKVQERFKRLPKAEKEKRLKRAETNIMWDGKENLTNISDDEKKKIIYNSRTLNEAFLDIDYELRGAEYFEKENLIPLLGSFGLGAGGESWLHLASNKSSLVDFWAGMGILEVRGDKIIEKTISKKQYEQIKSDLIKIQLDNDLSKISDNYSWIYVYKGKLPF